MKLIIGLGNPGNKYENTRHNLGFMVLDELLRKIMPVEKTKWRTEMDSLIAKTKDFVLAKPQTMMNASGFSVAKLASFYKVKPENIWVIHDDLDLVLGQIKITQKAASAGHRGVESIIKQLGTNNFGRFRLGIDRPHHAKGQVVAHYKKAEVDRHVLSGFTSKETTQVKKMVKKAVKAIEIALETGFESAMNRFNQ